MAELGITAEVADDLLGQFPPYLANAIAALRQAAADERWSGGDAANTSVMGVAHQVKGSACSSERSGSGKLPRVCRC